MSQSLLARNNRGAGNRFTNSRAGLSDTAAAAAALLEEGDRAHAGIPSDARDLLLSEIEPDPEQPRRHFDQAELNRLADDIRTRGVLQPILVRPPMEPGQRYRIVAGERRWRASSLAGKVRIPARVKEMTETEVRSAQLVENIIRTDLSDIEKGRALRHLYQIRKDDNPKTTWEDVAGEVGLGRARIHDLYQLAELPDEVATLIESGRLSGSHGIALQRAQEKLGDPEVIALARSAARSDEMRNGGYRMSVAALRATIQERLSPVIKTPVVKTPVAITKPADAITTDESIAIDAVLSTAQDITAHQDDGITSEKTTVKSPPSFIVDTLRAIRTGTISDAERQSLLVALGVEGAK